MARWQVEVFDTHTDDLVEQFVVHGLDRDRVRAIWNLQPHIPIELLLITERELGQLNVLIARPIHLRAEQEYLLGLVRDYPGEFIAEADGTRWFPPP